MGALLNDIRIMDRQRWHFIFTGWFLFYGICYSKRIFGKRFRSFQSVACLHPSLSFQIKTPCHDWHRDLELRFSRITCNRVWCESKAKYSKNHSKLTQFTTNWPHISHTMKLVSVYRIRLWGSHHICKSSSLSSLRDGEIILIRSLNIHEMLWQAYLTNGFMAVTHRVKIFQFSSRGKFELMHAWIVVCSVHQADFDWMPTRRLFKVGTCTKFCAHLFWVLLKLGFFT